MLELKNIKKSFDGITILNDISISIGDAEIVSILGSSGSGKTTLLNLILGITQPDSGTILFNGEDITKKPMELRDFNIVFQDYALFPNLNAYKNITYGLRNFPDRSTKEEVDSLIELLGLKDQLDKKIDKLSGGQKQRVALARTMVMKPKIKESIKEKIVTIAKDFHLTTIIVTHDPEEALTISDKVLIINKGNIEQFGTPDEIINSPASDFVNDFILKQLTIKKNNIFKLFDEKRNGNAQQAD
ncbi:ABC transporter ATP-binding protein [Treponema sp.]|uniref:ABC transporter ATP-binding protein n=1 Tax=Treponema sp. TaxID=166 RepID=UPI002580A131|nr:ABC transporter ATP-binding protein [Treponema sp.]